MKEEAKARLLKLMQETAHNQARLLTVKNSIREKDSLS
jgi:hypothetical protein